MFDKLLAALEAETIKWGNTFLGYETDFSSFLLYCYNHLGGGAAPVSPSVVGDIVVFNSTTGGQSDGGVQLSDVTTALGALESTLSSLETTVAGKAATADLAAKTGATLVGISDATATALGIAAGSKVENALAAVGAVTFALVQESDIAVDGTSHEAELPGGVIGITSVWDHTSGAIYQVGKTAVAPTDGAGGVCVYTGASGDTPATLTFATGDAVEAVDVLVTLRSTAS